ncbi:MAG TPA: hypothetical protein VNZ61_20985 [Roseomonas sp.]|nr:hypothetical protein [Roseomonas sp.]
MSEVGEKHYSLKELNLLFPDPAGQIRLQWAFAPNHAARVLLVEQAIDHIAQTLTRTRHLRQHKSEDLLTVDFVDRLVDMGFSASHDNDVGGHCDIVIDGREGFLWLGEAKIHSSYKWLYKGFQQLTTRYSSGLPGQDVGGLLIYLYNRNALEMMKAWREHLATERSDIKIEQCEANPLVFRSSHTHEVSGLPYTVRHVPVPLYFAPDDKIRSKTVAEKSVPPGTSSSSID